jgi:hypothetical protein
MDTLCIHLGLKPQAIGENPLKRVQDWIENGHFRGSILDLITRFNGF